MFFALGLALLTGLCWCLIGIIFSQAAERGLHPAVMSALSGLGVAVVTATWIDWPALGGTGHGTLIISMVVSALAMTVGMIALQMAMRHGKHGAAWAVAQSGLAWPFLVAVLIHGERPGVLPWVGLACIITSLGLLAERRGERQHQATGPWFSWAMLAWAMIGLQQSAFQWPSLTSALPDPAGIRVPLMNAVAGVSAAVLFIGTRRLSRPSGGRQTTSSWIIVPFAVVACAANVVAQPAIVRSSDLLAGIGAAGIAFPVAIAACIALFMVYSSIHRGERPQARAGLGLTCCLAGVVLMSL